MVLWRGNDELRLKRRLWGSRSAQSGKHGDTSSEGKQQHHGHCLDLLTAILALFQQQQLAWNDTVRIKFAPTRKTFEPDSGRQYLEITNVSAFTQSMTDPPSSGTDVLDKYTTPTRQRRDSIDSSLNRFASSSQRRNLRRRSSAKKLREAISDVNDVFSLNLVNAALVYFHLMPFHDHYGGSTPSFQRARL